MNRHSRYAFEPLPDGSGVYVSLFYDDKPVSQFFTHEEFRELLQTGIAASAEARDKRDDKRRQALGYATTPHGYHYIASGGGRGNDTSTDRVVGGYPGGGGGETIESLERRRRLMQYYHYPLNKPRPRRIVNRVTPRGIR